VKQILSAQFRLLFFRDVPGELGAQRNAFALYVLGVTWLVGIGRYWDSPDANWVQHLGIGSVAYLFVMSVILWCAIQPIAKAPVTISRIFIFVGMSSLPALLYAIPVEMFMSIDGAAKTNYWFLTVVAIWRVALLFFFCKRAVSLSTWGAMTATILPLCCIMMVLAALSLEHAVFDMMGGLRVVEDYERTTAGLVASSLTEAAGWSIDTVGGLSFLAFLLFPIFMISWIIKVIFRFKAKSAANNEMVNEVEGT